VHPKSLGAVNGSALEGEIDDQVGLRRHRRCSRSPSVPLRFLLEDDETYWVGQFSPFMQVAIAENDELIFNLYPSENSLSLCREQWQEILTKAQIFREETLTNDGN
jgi:hypothetical protein